MSDGRTGFQAVQQHVYSSDLHPPGSVFSLFIVVLTASYTYIMTVRVSMQTDTRRLFMSENLYILVKITENSAACGSCTGC